MPPTISILLTIYNKAAHLPATLSSLYGQDGAGTDFDTDFVLIDDASTDNSIATAEQFFSRHEACVAYIRNASNEGPAKSLNKGIAAARGQYVFVFDADDIAPANTLRTMLMLLSRDRLDYIYGRSTRTTVAAPAAFLRRLPAAPPYIASSRPWRLTRQRGIVHPVVLARRDILQKAGGCDDSVFIQDESLALRLALAAKRAGLIDAPCRFVLIGSGETGTHNNAGHLSRNRAQQHHDQYLTYIHLLAHPGLARGEKAWLARKAISPWWKSSRENGFHPFVFALYLLSRAWPMLILRWMRPQLDRYFLSLPNVRRVSSQ